MPTTALLPLPHHVDAMSGRFLLSPSATLWHDEASAGTAAWLRAELGAATGHPLPSGEASAAQIRLRVDPAAGLGPEGYALDVAQEHVDLVGHDAAGVFYAAQTFRQLLPAAAYRRAPLGALAWSAPCISLRDRPRFAWRGCMLDVARHFMPKRELLRFIDLMAMHKLNVLHLHLSDDQGWRLEIKRYPKLTELASWRQESQVGAVKSPRRFDGRPHGGYYGQDDVREIVAYAAARQVQVVPEIDVPGHSQAAIAAYPELGGGQRLDVGREWGIIEHVLEPSDETMAFYFGVFDEVMELFPSPYLCVGGDECPKTQWRSSPIAQARMRAEGLRDEDELQSWFIRRFDDRFAQHGRRLLGWDEILEGGLAPGATVLSWRGREGGIAAARAGHDVVMCPTDTAYLDYKQSDDPAEPIPVGTLLTLEQVYAAEPVPAELTEAEARHVLGAQVNVWTEHMDSPRTVDYMVFPRLSAFAETVWSGQDRSYEAFLPRLRQHLQRLDHLGVEYRREEGPLPWQRRPGVEGRGG